jgi:hypothetical protein
MPVVVVTRIRAKAGAEQQLERALGAMIEKARGEGRQDAPRYVLSRCADDPAVLELRECYAGDCAPDIVGDGALTSPVDELEGLIDGRPILQKLIELNDEG